jgi:hypothetical protein
LKSRVYDERRRKNLPKYTSAADECIHDQLICAQAQRGVKLKSLETRCVMIGRNGGQQEENVSIWKSSDSIMYKRTQRTVTSATGAVWTRRSAGLKSQGLAAPRPPSQAAVPLQHERAEYDVLESYRCVDLV